MDKYIYANDYLFLVILSEAKNLQLLKMAFKKSEQILHCVQDDNLDDSLSWNFKKKY